MDMLVACLWSTEAKWSFYVMSVAGLDARTGKPVTKIIVGATLFKFFKYVTL